MKYGYKRSREFARRLPSYRGENAASHPLFLEGSKVACRDAAMPVAINEPDLQYSAEDDKAIEEYTRKHVNTTWHSVCSLLLLVAFLEVSDGMLARDVCDEASGVEWSCGLQTERIRSDWPEGGGYGFLIISVYQLLTVLFGHRYRHVDRSSECLRCESYEYATQDS